jgi:plastocyanin
VKRLAGFAMAACLIFAAAPGAVAHASRPGDVDAKKAKVKITNFKFSPTPLTVKKGTKVIWINKAVGTSHTTTSDTGAWDSGVLAPGAKFSHKFTTVGTFTYHCSIHPTMMAEVDVTG